jgi:hypothetical protein
MNLDLNPKWMMPLKWKWFHEPNSWHKILAVYLSRYITYPSYRLPAIFGIVKQMQAAGAGDVTGLGHTS